MRVSLALIVAFLAGVSVTVAESLPIPSQWSGIVLTNAAQIRQLPASEAGKTLRVAISGVVIDKADPKQQALILDDGGTGIYVRPAPHANANLFVHYHRGDVVEIQGVTDPGQFAPIVLAETEKKLGTAKIPKAEPVTYQQLITGALDAQWVEIEGVVRDCYNDSYPTNAQTLIIASDGGLVPVGLVHSHAEKAAQIDSEVRIQAVCVYRFDQERQVLTPVLQIPRGEPIFVEKAAPVHPFDTPLRSAASLLRFSPNLDAYAHYVHVRGTVTCCQPGAFVWIRDGTVGLCLQTSQNQLLKPGDEIDALGFPNFGSYPPILGNAIYRKIGTTGPLTPVPLASFKDAFDHGNDLVAVNGTLTDVQPVLTGIALTLDRDGESFKAFFQTSSPASKYTDWRPGSKVHVVGICSMAYDNNRPAPGIWEPKSFEIVLRSPADLTVITRPPWWTSEHITMLLGTVTCILVLLIGLVMALSRRRLREQELQRQMAEGEFAAILSERNRMAREIHDTIAQGLTAMSVQLRLAKKSLNGGAGAAVEHIDTAQQLVRESLEESRDTIWNMRAHVLEKNNLADALNDILKQMANGMEMKTHFEVLGRLRRLAPMVENNILRVGQEAISNATKYSKAERIDVTLEFSNRRFRLEVKDNGCGFEPSNPPLSAGGFGLIGMRERAVELKGTLNIRSSPGSGSSVVLDVPLSMG